LSHPLRVFNPVFEANADQLLRIAFWLNWLELVFEASFLWAPTLDRYRSPTRQRGSAQMPRLTAKDFAPELLELYDYYARAACGQGRLHCPRPW